MSDTEQTTEPLDISQIASQETRQFNRTIIERYAATGLPYKIKTSLIAGTAG